MSVDRFRASSNSPAPGKVVIHVQHMGGVSHCELLVALNHHHVFIVIVGSLITQVVTSRHNDAVISEWINDNNLVVRDRKSGLKQLGKPAHGRVRTVEGVGGDDSRILRDWRPFWFWLTFSDRLLLRW